MEGAFMKAKCKDAGVGFKCFHNTGCPEVWARQMPKVSNCNRKGGGKGLATTAHKHRKNRTLRGKAMVCFIQSEGNCQSSPCDVK